MHLNSQLCVWALNVHTVWIHCKSPVNVRIHTDQTQIKMECIKRGNFQICNQRWNQKSSQTSVCSQLKGKFTLMSEFWWTKRTQVWHLLCTWSTVARQIRKNLALKKNPPQSTAHGCCCSQKIFNLVKKKKKKKKKKGKAGNRSSFGRMFRKKTTPLLPIGNRCQRGPRRSYFFFSFFVCCFICSDLFFLAGTCLNLQLFPKRKSGGTSLMALGLVRKNISLDCHLWRLQAKQTQLPPHKHSYKQWAIK